MTNFGANGWLSFSFGRSNEYNTRYGMAFIDNHWS